jgi:hypothetical protein
MRAGDEVWVMLPAAEALSWFGPDILEPDRFRRNRFAILSKT